MSKFLTYCRYLMLVPVIGCVLLAAGASILGLAQIFRESFRLISEGDLSHNSIKSAALAIIQIIDLFLFGTVAFITSVGLYKLFVSNQEVELPTLLRIRDLRELESNIIGVITAALGVAFLGKATGDYETETVLHFGIGVAVVVIALAIFNYLGNLESDRNNSDTNDEAKADG